MTITTNLGKSSTVIMLGRHLVDDSDDLFLRFESEFDLSKAKVEIKNEEGTAAVLEIENDQVLVPDKFMVEGRLFVKVNLFSAVKNDRIIKRWELTPIKIEHDFERGQKIIIDYMLALEGRIVKLENNTKITK